VRTWSFPDLVLQHTLQDRKKTAAGVAISADRALITAAYYGGRVVVWKSDGQPLCSIKASDKNLGAVAISPDNLVLAVSGLGAEILLFSLPEGRLIKRLVGHEIAVSGLKFIHGGKWLVSLGYEQKIVYWDRATWQIERTLASNAPGLRGIRFSPDEKLVALSLESKVELRNADDWSVLADLPVSTKVINGMAFTGDNRTLALGAADRKIRIWDLA
jgi:WD40 repeat protein